MESNLWWYLRATSCKSLVDGHLAFEDVFKLFKILSSIAPEDLQGSMVAKYYFPFYDSQDSEELYVYFSQTSFLKSHVTYLLRPFGQERTVKGYTNKQKSRLVHCMQSIFGRRKDSGGIGSCYCVGKSPTCV